MKTPILTDEQAAILDRLKGIYVTPRYDRDEVCTLLDKLAADLPIEYLAAELDVSRQTLYDKLKRYRQRAGLLS